MPKIARFSLLFILFLTFSKSFAQDKLIDSVKVAFQNVKIQDTTKMNYLGHLLQTKYNQNNPNYYYIVRWIGRIAEKTLAESKVPAVRKSAASWMGTYYNGMAIESFFKGEIDKSVPYVDKAIEQFQSVKDLDNVNYHLIVKAQFLFRTNQTEKAVECLFKALKYYETNKKDNLEKLAYATSTLAGIYVKQLKYKEAIEFYKKAVSYYEAEESDENAKKSLEATAYSSMASCYQQLKNFPEAVTYNNKALALFRKIGDSNNERLILGKLGTIKLDQDQYDEAEKIFLDLLKGKMDARSEIHHNVALGRLYYEKKEYAKALPYAERGYNLSIEKKYLDLQEPAANILFKIYKENNDYKKALDVQEFSIRLKDSSKVEASKNALAQQQLKYDFEKKQLQQELIQQHKLTAFKLEQERKVSAVKLEAQKKSEIQRSKDRLAQQRLKYDFEKKALNQKIAQGKKMAAIKLEGEKKTAAKNNWVIGLSGALLLLLVGIYFYYRNNKQKQAIAGLEKNQIKQKLMITQMNPHFIFNSIDNIQGLIHDHKDEDAVNYLTKFSKLTRQILENSNENYISLAEEVEMTENYLSIQQLLYSNKFNFKINVAEEIDTESILLPPMLTQPFIENAIKHGISNTVNGMIDICFFLKENKLFFEVSDNGKGFDASKRTDNHKSLAMTITKERLVNYTKNQDFVVQTDNIKDNNQNIVGAKVSFEIPYIYEN